MVKLSIVILSFNTADLTIECLKSINNQYKKQLETGEFEIVAVDNGSHDDSVKKIKDLGADVQSIRLVESKENLGFSKGCNLGAAKSRGEYILFLNSDTEVLDTGFLKMVEFLDRNEHASFLGGRLLNIDGSYQSSAGKFYTLFNFFLMLFGGERFGFLRQSPNKISKVDWISGACFMARKSVFEKLKDLTNIFLCIWRIWNCVLEPERINFTLISSRMLELYIRKEKAVIKLLL